MTIMWEHQSEETIKAWEHLSFTKCRSCIHLNERTGKVNSMNHAKVCTCLGKLINPLAINTASSACPCRGRHYEKASDFANIVGTLYYTEENCEKILDLLIKAGDLGFDWQIIMPYDKDNGK